MVHLHSTPLHLPDTLRRLLTPTLSTLPFEQAPWSGLYTPPAGVYGRPSAIIYTIMKQVSTLLSLVTHSADTKAD